MLRAHIDTMHSIPFGNQRTYYHAIIKAIKVTRDYSLFDLLPEDILQSENFTDIIKDTLEEDEITIRGIVEFLKGKENQQFMESLFLKIFKKELIFADSKKAPAFNKEKSDAYIEQYKENEHLIHRTKVKRVLVKIAAAFEIILSVLLSLSLGGVSYFPFRKHSYFLGVVLLLVGLGLGIWMFVRLEEIISLKRERRLFNAKRTLDNLENENVIILKKVYLGLE